MLNLIKKIRERTGAGVVAIKNALNEAGGDEEKAIEILRKLDTAKWRKRLAGSQKRGLLFMCIQIIAWDRCETSLRNGFCCAQ